MANTNIMTGYTYILVIVFLQLLLGISYPVVWAKALANSGVAMPLQIQCHAHKSITLSCMLTLPDQSNIASYTLEFVWLLKYHGIPVVTSHRV